MNKNFRATIIKHAKRVLLGFFGVIFPAIVIFIIGFVLIQHMALFILTAVIVLSYTFGWYFYDDNIDEQ